MSKKRTIILLNAEPPATGSDAAALVPLGELSVVLKLLANCNLAPDGSGPMGMGERVGSGLLFGPGMVVEIPMSGSPDDLHADVMQLMVTVTDEDFAWPVLRTMCKNLKWKMMDAETRRTFGG